tara:strand:+ start:1066 stop:1764 length:699 start_codon:yes stop_codon:yes gene_type:complete
MNISICIPCVDKHIPLLCNFLKTITYFTRKPDEIIISLSPKFDKLDLNNIKNTLEKNYLCYNLKCLVQNKQTNCATNLNKCFDIVTGDIIIISGADDIIHPQKLEIIEYLFNKYPETTMILHNLINSNNRDYSLKIFDKYDINDLNIYSDLISCKPFGLLSKKFQLDTNSEFGPNYVCGAPTIKKKILNNIKFKDVDYGEDAHFITDIHNYYKSTIYIPFKLMSYTPSGSFK